MVTRAPSIDRAPALYLVTDAHGPRGLAPFEEALAWVASHDLLAGSIALQLRDGETPSDVLAERAARLRSLARAAGVPFLVNARLDVADALDADGVHLKESSEASTARRGRGARLAASVHDRAGAERRAAEGVDFVVLGPVGPVPGKNKPLAWSAFAAVVDRIAPTPVLALGGVRSASDAHAARRAGAAGIAVMRALSQAHRGDEALAEVLSWLADNRQTTGAVR